MQALWREAEVADDGNFSLGESANEFDARAFNFDGFGAGFFDEANGVGEAVRDGAVVAAERHVNDDEGTADGATHGAGVVKHLIDGNGEGVFMAEDDHGK